MRAFIRLTAAVTLLLGLSTARLDSARAEIVNDQAHVESTVHEIDAGSVIQTDTASLDLPGTATQPPLLVRTKLSRTDPVSALVSGARGLVLFDAGKNGVPAAPNNVGMDIAAFSTSNASGWTVDGLATERRTIIIRPNDVGLANDRMVQVDSTLNFSGVLLITSPDPKQDLSGAEATVDFKVTQERAGDAPRDVLAGGAALMGNAPRAVASKTFGAVNGFFHGVISLDGVVPEFPVLRAVFFVGALPIDQYSYRYAAKVGETFDLVLTVHATVKTPPGQVGSVAVFGVPQEGFADLYQKAKGSDAGARLAEVISSHVDTTGQDHPAADSLVTPASPFALTPLTCGTLGLESAGLLAFGAMAAFWSGSRRRMRIGRR